MNKTAKYRLLTDNDTIQEGDEFLCEDCITWEAQIKPETYSNHFLGCKFNPYLFMPHRRKIVIDK
jgi:hypothetical protein